MDGRQGPAEDEIVATKATPDITCWLLAAVPPNERGGVNATRAAQVLQVSRSTVYRWLKTAQEREFEPEARRVLARYAVLRGHGDYLWPPLDPASATRQAAYLSQAEAGVRNASADPDTYREWKSATATAEVFTYYHPAAKVFGIAYGTTPTNRRRLVRGGAVVLESLEVPSTMHAKALKYTVLALVGDRRCIAPRELVGDSRTEVWLQRAGDVDLEAVWRHVSHVQ